MERQSNSFEFPNPFEGAKELDDPTIYDKHLDPPLNRSSFWRFSPQMEYSPLPDDQDKAFEETLRREQIVINETKESIGG